MILIIDNYDSFTYNLYQAFATITQDVMVVRNDKITLDEIKDLNPDGIVLSPGPGHPENSGICIDVIKTFGKEIPILGVCLGHQAIGIAFGGVVKRASLQLHGKQTKIFHNQTGLFKGIKSPFDAGRYHSLIIDRLSIPSSLAIDAQDIEGNIMAVSHKSYPIFGLQFHPESILTPDGIDILKNFIGICHVI